MNAKRALVTGASSGLGHVFSKQLATSCESAPRFLTHRTGAVHLQDIFHTSKFL